MLKLHGFSSSNYYNAAKLALFEKELEFEEVLIYTGANEHDRPEYLEKSPLGKVPCLETDRGFISESRCIIDYLEHAHPQHPLYPEGTFARAKLLELTQIVDLYLELPARRLLPNFFAQKDPPASIANDVRDVLAKGTKALDRLARFDAYVLGDRFTAADVSCVVHLPVVRRVVRSVLKDDPLCTIAGLDAYLSRMEARATVQRVRADQNANFPDFIAHIRKRFGQGN
jgi:glutathione S-transferase